MKVKDFQILKQKKDKVIGDQLIVSIRIRDITDYDHPWNKR